VIPDLSRDDLVANLEVLERLLDTMTDVLDVREMLDRVSEIARPVLPHDLMGVVEIADDGSRIRLHASSTIGQPSFDLPISQADLLKANWDVVIVNDFADRAEYAGTPAANAGMQSLLSVPVRYGGRLRAKVNIFSRRRDRFSRADLPIAQRLASHIALAMSHRALSEELRQRQVLESRAAALDLLDQSLSVLTGAGGVNDVFARISSLTQPVLAHDAMILWVSSPGRHGKTYAATGVEGEIPASIDMTTRDADWDFAICDDATAGGTDVTEAALATLGFRSLLQVPVRLEHRFVGALMFLSRAIGAYEPALLPIARRVANRIAVSLEREFAAAATKRADEATERAARLEARVRALSDELDARTGYRRVLGESASWRHVLTQATQVAAAETTVLLLGESGTGKEVVARFVHRASARARGPFVALNCAALPEHLLEAELFGFERGAFTGATQSKPGQIEQAAGGVLFLDEVGEMTMPAQAKVLRVLQEREFQRLGGNRVLKADVRVVAATNRDLKKAIERGAFREDLYYRLNVFAITLPALRDRREDILPMSEVFIQEIGRSLGRPPAGLARDARQALIDYQWPGNVRELRNMLERAAILADGGLIVRDHLAIPLDVPAAVVNSGESTTDVRIDNPKSEHELIEKALFDARFNKAKAAKSLGLTRAQLYVRLKRHGLE
jgi:transcriptional regulator with GAF, ATPase, and Fis domain